MLPSSMRLQQMVLILSRHLVLAVVNLVCHIGKQVSQARHLLICSLLGMEQEHLRRHQHQQASWWVMDIMEHQFMEME